MNILESTKKYDYKFYQKLSAMDTPWSDDFYNFNKIVEYKNNNCHVLIKNSGLFVWNISIMIKNESIIEYIRTNRRKAISKISGFYCFKHLKECIDGNDHFIGYKLTFVFNCERDIIPVTFIKYHKKYENNPNATYKDLEYAKKCSEDIIFYIFNYL